MMGLSCKPCAVISVHCSSRFCKLGRSLRLCMRRSLGVRALGCRLFYPVGLADLSMAKLELPKVGEAKVDVDDGNMLEVLRDLDPNDSTYFGKEMSVTNVKQFDAEGNILHGSRCQLVHC